MLAHCLRKWLSSKTALAKHHVFAESHQQLDTLTQCWFNVETVSSMMAQHLTNMRSVDHVDCLEPA